MDLKTIFEQVLPIAQKIAATTETEIDDAVIKVLACLYDHFGPLVFGSEDAGQALDAIPSGCVADVEQLIARVEASGAD